MTVSNDDMVRVDVIGDANLASEIVQVYEFKLLDGGPIADLTVMTDLVDLFEALWLTLAQLHAISTIFRRMKGQDVVSKRLLPEQSFSPELAGVVAGSDIPDQISMPISFLTTVPRVVLRKSYGPMATGSFGASGLVNAGALTIAGSVSTFLLTDQVFNGRTYQYGYLSPKTLGWVVPSSSVFSNAAGSLTRRRPGSGS